MNDIELNLVISGSWMPQPRGYSAACDQMNAESHASRVQKISLQIPFDEAMHQWSLELACGKQPIWLAVQTFAPLASTLHDREDINPFCCLACDI